MRFFLLLTIAATSSWAQTQIEIVPKSQGGMDLFVPCQLGGQNNRCLLSMGSPYNVIPRADAKLLKQTHDSIEVSSPQLKGKTARCPVVKTKVLLGKSELNESDSLLCDLFGEKIPMLGIKALDQLQFQLNFDQNLLTTTSGPQSLQNYLSYQSAEGHIFIDVSIHGTTFPALIDSSYSLTTVHADFARNLPQIFKQIGTGEAGNNAYRIDSLALQGEKYSMVVIDADLSPLAQNLDFPFLMVIGANWISQANWNFDLKKKTWSATKTQARQDFESLYSAFERSFRKELLREVETPDLYALYRTGSSSGITIGKSLFSSSCSPAPVNLEKTDLQNTPLANLDAKELAKRLDNLRANLKCAKIKYSAK